MPALGGKISDKLRKLFASGAPEWSAKRHGEAPPSTKAIKSAKGQGLGKGATRKRSGPGAS